MILYWEGHIIQGRPEEITEFIRMNTPCTVTTTTLGTGTTSPVSPTVDPNLVDLFLNKSFCELIRGVK